MSNPQIAPPPLASSSKKRKRNESLKATLDRVDLALNVLNDVASLVPVAGFANAVPIVRRIVEQIRVSALF
jgi:hypothetical protein